MKILNLTSTILSALILTTSLASASMPGKPFTGNPGECPMYVQGCPDDKPQDPIQCNTDFDCEPNHKCCGTPCFGRTCIVSTVQKAGECEDPKRELADCAADAYNNSHADCSHDFQCSGEYKCCPQTCVKPRCALPKLTCPPVCAIACTYGQVLDSNGCPTCSCNPNPCESQACGVDQHCEVQTVQCVRAPCPPQAVCVDNDYYKCPPQCPIGCPFDLKRDSKGCPLCECGPDPCLGVTCQTGQVCKAQLTTCRGGNCPYTTTCVNQPSENGGSSQVNPGYCPQYAPGPGCDGRPVDTIECNNDLDCEPNHKCCGTPCSGKRCEASWVGLKAGECEDPKREVSQCLSGQYDNSTRECSHDGQCPGDEKCCPQPCVKPRCALPKPACPPVCAIACDYGNVLDNNGCPTCSCNPNPCESQTCRRGQHCEVQNVQCVRAPCPPHAVCVDNDSSEEVNEVVKSEVTVNPGYCPQYAPGPGCEGRPNDPIECNNDLDCEPNHKCCGTPCSGKRCEASWVGLKAGECEDPKREVSRCLSGQYDNSTRECSHDGQCPGDEKCCPQTCVKPRCALPKPACPPVCKIYCEFGNVLDSNDCPTCSCKPNPCEVVDCGEDKHCELQNVQCIKAPCYPVATCVDNKPKECPPVCAVFCEFGYVLDDNNCPTCTCKPNPCTLVDCAANKSCEVQNVQCFTAPCDPIAVCVDNTNTCPPTCKIRCEYGNVLDENLCPTCQCVEPCKDKVCGAGEVCQVQNVQCVKAPCYPIGVCAKPRPTNPERIPELVCPEPENACPTGQRRLTCADDSGCGDKKCCSTGCGYNICLPPVRAGSCPKKDPFALCGPHSADESVDKCGSDHVCPGAQKCCPFVCPGYGLRCQEPVY